MRIILRTGQPGRAPENVVAANYGIDDHKTKTELTAKKLFITVVTALRVFSTLTNMLETSRNLELVVVQHQHTEATLRNSELREREKAQRLERSLRAVQHEKIESLSQLITDVTHEMICLPHQRNAPYTMSMITRMARMVLRITDEHSAKLGLSQSKLAILVYLSREPALCASPSALAKHCGVSRAAITGLLDGLEQEAYVERDSHPSDRRALIVKLTQKGQQFIEWIGSQDQYQMSELMITLNEAERKKLLDLVMHVIQLFEDETLDAAAGEPEAIE